LGCELGITNILENNEKSGDIVNVISSSIINDEKNIDIPDSGTSIQHDIEKQTYSNAKQNNDTYQNNNFEKYDNTDTENEMIYQKILLLNKLMSHSIESSESINNSNQSIQFPIDLFNNNNNIQLKNVMNIVIKNIRNTHSLLIEITVFYLVFVVFTCLIVFFNYISNNDNKIIIVQSENGEWYYKCNMETVNFIYDIYEAILAIIIIVKGRNIISYNCIFKNVKFMIYSIIIGIVFGPIINVSL